MTAKGNAYRTRTLRRRSRRRRAQSRLWALSSHIRAGFRDLADHVQASPRYQFLPLSRLSSTSLHHVSGYIYFPGDAAVVVVVVVRCRVAAIRTPPAPHKSPAPLPFAAEASFPCRSRCPDIRRRATLLQVTLRQATLRNNPHTTNKAPPSWARLPRTSSARPSAAAAFLKAAWRRFAVAAWWTNAAVIPQSSLTKFRAFLDRSAGLEAGVAIGVGVGLVCP